MNIKKLLLLFSILFLSMSVFAQPPKMIQNNTTQVMVAAESKNKMSPELSKKEQASLNVKKNNKKESDESLVDKMRRGWNSFIDVLVGKAK